jgi:hypothetical protein
MFRLRLDHLVVQLEHIPRVIGGRQVLAFST